MPPFLPPSSARKRSPEFMLDPTPTDAAETAWPVMLSTDHEGRLRIPAPDAETVAVRFAPLSARDRFAPEAWRREPLQPVPSAAGYYEVDINSLHLPDGTYEYEFLVSTGDGSPRVVPDPFAEEITRFGGYRGIFHIGEGRRVRPTFSWEDELPGGRALPNNNEIVIYEMPLRWMEAESPDYARQVGLGDFDHVIFAHLDRLTELGINAIELLPVQDSADTLNWGYGTRFFFAPDFDMGMPVDMKFFVKCCHQRGIRVFLDVVMNHARDCPLDALAEDWFFLRSGEEPDRPSWGGRRFNYRRPAPDVPLPTADTLPVPSTMTWPPTGCTSTTSTASGLTSSKGSITGHSCSASGTGPGPRTAPSFPTGRFS